MTNRSNETSAVAAPVRTTSAAQSIRRKLGRGLGSLISSPVRVELPANSAIGTPAIVPDSSASGRPRTLQSHSSQPAEKTTELPDHSRDSEIRLLELDCICPNPHQPRQHFDEESLRALALSITSSGLMQPIVVRLDRTDSSQTAVGETYQIIAGERRWRAAQLANLQRIPALIRDADDRTAAELSLIENIQREDLNPMERADAFQRLIDDFHLTHNEIAERVGLDRSSVTNHVRLNELDDFSKDSLRAGRLSLGHGKALLAITNIEVRAALAALAVRQAWSVRELERQVKLTSGGGGRPIPTLPKSSHPAVMPPHMADLQRRLSEHLGTKVRIYSGRTKGSGRLVIEFFTLDQFEGLMRRMQFASDES